MCLSGEFFDSIDYFFDLSWVIVTFRRKNEIKILGFEPTTSIH
jgi:hypothetical protein